MLISHLFTLKNFNEKLLKLTGNGNFRRTPVIVTEFLISDKKKKGKVIVCLESIVIAIEMLSLISDL